MRSYGQYCAVARALDLVGDRWTLLIARELYLRGPSRYTDLRNGLPGIATNLLADRLRDLEEAGLVAREAAPPPVASALFSLTDRGRELRPVLAALLQFGASKMADPPGDDVVRSHWFTFPAEQFLVDHAPEEPPVTIEVRTGDQPLVLETADGRVRARTGTADEPDAVISGDPQLVMGVLSGGLELAEAKRGGLRYEGDPKALSRVRGFTPAAA
jgi:DNA-binding HxlR family transcriptional regulator